MPPPGTRQPSPGDSGSSSSSPIWLAEMNGQVYFYAGTSSTSGLWRTDGTSAGTSPVYTAFSFPRELINFGGTLFFAGLAYNPNGRLLDSLVQQVRALPIELRFSTPATAALVAELKPDAIVVATGARRDAPAIPGAGLGHVWSGDELRRWYWLKDRMGFAS